MEGVKSSSLFLVLYSASVNRFMTDIAETEKNGFVSI